MKYFVIGSEKMYIYSPCLQIKLISRRDAEAQRKTFSVLLSASAPLREKILQNK